MLKCDQHFKTLRGSWVFERSVNDLLLMRGKASFCAVKSVFPSYSYYEEGENLETENIFYKEYFFSLTERGIEIFFASLKQKQGHFLTLKFISDQTAIAQHICQKDLYEAQYDFVNNDQFTVRFIVKGPRKDFALFSAFSRD